MSKMLGKLSERFAKACCSGDAAANAATDAKADRDSSDEDAPREKIMHGMLTLEIISATDLPNTDVHMKPFRRNKDLTDPYVTVDTVYEEDKTCRIAKTSVIDDDLNPVWNETFRVDLCNAVDYFHFKVKDVDMVRTETVCSMTVRAEDVRGGPIEGWFFLTNNRGKQRGKLRIRMEFVSADSIAHSNECRDAYFPMRGGCRVKLYQDAHTPPVPPVTDVAARDGSRYDPPCLWVDTLRAMEGARKFIYVVGWAVWTDLALLRGPAATSTETLGDMLVRKANEGVRVMVMVWDEAMSTEVYPCGLMGTHDEATQKFFAPTAVEVFLSPRKKNKAKLLEGNWVGTTYTHHQKCVLADAPIDGEEDGRRRIVAFVGGIDLTDGRYDTPAHELYGTLPDEHSSDFYNGTAPSVQPRWGPRQPWHDIHMYVEGGGAYDLVRNFQERWLKQNERRRTKLYPIDGNHDEFDLDWTSPAEESESSWNVQLFRSINEDSALFDPNLVAKKLKVRKGRVYEDSIQQAYIHQIRRSKRFIYIENQYFLGSCFAWTIPETTKCPHLVPVELVARIVRAIEEGDEFRVYVCVPLQPEGDPKSAAVQEVLRWQSRTMDMMYRKIVRAIKKKKIRAQPQDYLSFFCLTKREGPSDVPTTSLDVPPSGSVAARCRASLRFMIYVHSKFAIIDDEYVIVGSANINERSMSGNRDTELAMGAYQPAFTKEIAGDGNEVRGDVRTFRLALWAEHCGRHMEEHLAPSSVECMDAMRALGDENLDKYISDEVGRNDSHLTAYPLRISPRGHVDDLEKCEDFPDLGGSVKGKNSMALPNSITT